MTDQSPTSTSSQHFEVSKEGLKQLLERKDKSFIVTELVQNSWDEDGSRVDVVLVALDDDVDTYRLVVEDDDPEGFTNITHAYTLFAESEKKSDASKRGRFNLGEKLVIAACERAEISTTTGRAGTRPLLRPDAFPGFSLGLSNCSTTSAGTTPAAAA